MQTPVATEFLPGRVGVVGALRRESSGLSRTGHISNPKQHAARNRTRTGTGGDGKRSKQWTASPCVNGAPASSALAFALAFAFCFAAALTFALPFGCPCAAAAAPFALGGIHYKFTSTGVNTWNPIFHFFFALRWFSGEYPKNQSPFDAWFWVESFSSSWMSFENFPKTHSSSVTCWMADSSYVCCSCVFNTWASIDMYRHADICGFAAEEKRQRLLHSLVLVGEYQ